MRSVPVFFDELLNILDIVQNEAGLPEPELKREPVIWTGRQHEYRIPPEF